MCRVALEDCTELDRCAKLGASCCNCCDYSYASFCQVEQSTRSHDRYVERFRHAHGNLRGNKIGNRRYDVSRQCQAACHVDHKANGPVWGVHMSIRENMLRSPTIISFENVTASSPLRSNARPYGAVSPSLTRARQVPVRSHKFSR